MEPDHIHQDKKDDTGVTVAAPNTRLAKSHSVRLPQPCTENRWDKIGRQEARLGRCSVDTLELTQLLQIVPKNAPYPGQPINVFQVIAKNG